MSEASESPITFITSDSKEVEMPRNASMLSKLVQSIIDCGNDSDDDEEITSIPLHNVTEETFNKIIDYCTHYLVSTHPEPTEKFPIVPLNYMTKHVSPWEATFMDMDQDAACTLLLAADYLNIPQLIDLITNKIACDLRNTMTSKQIYYYFRKLQGITSDNDSDSEDEGEAETKKGAK